MLWVNGIKMPAPSKLDVGEYDVSASASRNAAGEMMIDRVTTKRKLEMEWPALMSSETSTLLSAITEIFFTVTYPDPATGANATMTCYCGDRTAPLALMRSGQPIWNGFKMNWIER